MKTLSNGIPRGSSFFGRETETTAASGKGPAADPESLFEAGSVVLRVLLFVRHDRWPRRENKKRMLWCWPLAVVSLVPPSLPT